jgi:hypothetical protein
VLILSAIIRAMSGKRGKIWPALLLSFLLFACGRRTTTPTPLAIETPEPTAVVPLASPTVSLPEPTLPQPTETPAPTPEAACTNDAKFVEDLTVPDGTHILLGQTFSKKWSVQNSGTCDWGPDYRLVLVSGDALGAPSELALYPAKVGTTVAWEILMTAPLTLGEYTGRWQARDPDGNLFGALVFIKIEVIPLPVTEPPPALGVI